MEEERSKLSPHLEAIFKEMFKRVGVEYSYDYMMQDDWYTKETWSVKEENDFCLWMFDYIYDNPEVCNELLDIGYINPKHLRSMIDMFVLDFGWSSSDYGGEEYEIQ